MKDKIFTIICGISVMMLAMGVITFIREGNEAKERVAQQKEIQEQMEKEEAQREVDKLKKEKELETIEGWVNQNENSNFDDENKIMYISNSFPRHFSLKNRLLMANTDVYDYVKKLEESYPNEVESYVINFTHELVDDYGNKSDDVVYEVTLNRKELNKVNWEGIEPSSLVKLGYAKENPVLKTIE